MLLIDTVFHGRIWVTGHCDPTMGMHTECYPALGTWAACQCPCHESKGSGS